MDHANRTIGDLQKSGKRLGEQVAEMQSQLEEEQRAVAEARDSVVGAERHANAVAAEAEEVRAAMEAAERARKATEMQLHEAIEQVGVRAATSGEMSIHFQLVKFSGEIFQSFLEVFSGN